MAKTLELQITKVKCIRRTTTRARFDTPFGPIWLETDPDSLDFSPVLVDMSGAVVQPFPITFLGNQYNDGSEVNFQPPKVVMQTLVREDVLPTNYSVSLLLAEKDDGAGFGGVPGRVAQQLGRELGTYASRAGIDLTPTVPAGVWDSVVREIGRAVDAIFTELGRALGLGDDPYLGQTISLSLTTTNNPFNGNTTSAPQIVLFKEPGGEGKIEITFQWRVRDGVPSSSNGATGMITSAIAGLTQQTPRPVWFQLTSGPATSAEPSRIDVFARGLNGSMHHKSFGPLQPWPISAGHAWTDWEDLGGQILDNPAVAVSEPGTLHCFARGSDNAMWHKWYAGGWHDWENLGGVITAGPAVSSWAPGRLDCFVRGSDGALHHKWFQGSWSDWEGLGGQIIGNPAAVSWASGRIDVFARGTDDALWHKWYDNGWHDWESLGGTLSSGPAVSSMFSGRLDIFARGSDGAMWHKWFQEGWWEWESLGGQIVDAPATVASDSRTIHCFARGLDDALYQKFWNERGWSQWIRLG
jgi:hypothetical protein